MQMLPSFRDRKEEAKNKRKIKQEWKERNTDFEGDIRNQRLQKNEDYVDIIKCDNVAN
jgi:hypothetical protein